VAILFGYVHSDDDSRAEKIIFYQKFGGMEILL
jgi:hypothetical protein